MEITSEYLLCYIRTHNPTTDGNVSPDCPEICAFGGPPLQGVARRVSAEYERSRLQFRGRCRTTMSSPTVDPNVFVVNPVIPTNSQTWRDKLVESGQST